MDKRDVGGNSADFGLGLRQKAVVLVAHNPAWKNAFAIEAKVIRATLGERQIDIQHIGSTSIPGIRSKPILDLMVGIADLDLGPALAPLMATIGYDFAPHAGVPNDHVFGKGIERTHLVHVVEYGGANWRHNLRFRDRLLSNPDLAHEYDELKQRLASHHRDDRAAYTEAKRDFIDWVAALP